MYTAPPTTAVNAARPAASLQTRKDYHFINGRQLTLREVWCDVWLTLGENE